MSANSDAGEAIIGCGIVLVVAAFILFLPWIFLWCISTIMPNSGATPGFFTTQWWAALVLVLLFGSGSLTGIFGGENK